MQLSLDWNDDLCRICSDGGELICCEGCPASFHKECVGLDAIPEGDWFCPTCRCCVCAKSTVSTTVFEELMLICDQCEREFHVKCVEEKLTRLPKGDWFCGGGCRALNRDIRGLCEMGEVQKEGDFSYLWLSGKEAKKDELRRAQLKRCTEVVGECFLPMKDRKTQRNLIPLIVRGSKSPPHDFTGFKCLALLCKGEIVCVATVRVFSKEVAEMPFIATPFKCRGQGYARRTMDYLEESLHSVGVQRLLLPALGEIQRLWSRFGYHVAGEEQRRQFYNYRILAFPGCTVMSKKLSTTHVTTTHDAPTQASTPVLADKARLDAASVSAAEQQAPGPTPAKPAPTDAKALEPQQPSAK